MASTLSCCAESINEQVFTITTSASPGSFVISTPSFSSVPSIISASTRFLAQPSEIRPTRMGLFMDTSLIKAAMLHLMSYWRNGWDASDASGYHRVQDKFVVSEQSNRV